MVYIQIKFIALKLLSVTESLTHNLFCNKSVRPVVWEAIAFYSIVENKRKRIPQGQSKMDNPEKLATYGTQDEERRNII